MRLPFCVSLTPVCRLSWGMKTTLRSQMVSACAAALMVVLGGCGDDIRVVVVMSDGGQDTAQGGQGGIPDGGSDAAARDGGGLQGDGAAGDGGGADAQAQLVSVTITPANASIAKGTRQSLAATAVYSDNSTRNITSEATWSSSQEPVATVSNAAGTQGWVTSVAEGMTSITASLAGLLGSTTFTVTPAVLESVTVEPSAPFVPAGLSQAFTAVGRFSDGSVQDLTSQAMWSSSIPTVATVSNVMADAGLAKALTVGSSTIAAAFAGKMGSVSMTVTAATLATILITPSQAAIAAGTNQPYLATGVFSDNSTKDLTEQVVWTTSDATKATISNIDGSRGSAEGKVVGNVTITASLGSVMGTTNLSITNAVLEAITIDPIAPKVVKGTNVQFSASGTYSDGSTQDLTGRVTWTSATPATATISNAAGSQGLAAPQAAGTSLITATISGVSANTTLTVTAAALVSIAVDPVAATVAKFSQVPLRATATFADATTQDVTMQAAWVSSDGAIVSISNASKTRGVATAQAAGTAMLSATFQGIVGSATINVTDATLTTITVTPAASSVIDGANVDFVATATFSDGTMQNVTARATWSSASHAVAVISNASGKKGMATAKGAGTTNISALLGGVTGTTSLTVVQATLLSIAITPANSTGALGTMVPFKAIGTYSGNITQDITSLVKWDSSAKAVASVSNAARTKGNVTALSLGPTTIEVKLRQIKGSTMFTVVQP